MSIKYDDICLTVRKEWLDANVLKEEKPNQTEYQFFLFSCLCRTGSAFILEPPITTYKYDLERTCDIIAIYSQGPIIFDEGSVLKDEQIVCHNNYCLILPLIALFYNDIKYLCALDSQYPLSVYRFSTTLNIRRWFRQSSLTLFMGRSGVVRYSYGCFGYFYGKNENKVESVTEMTNSEKQFISDLLQPMVDNKYYRNMINKVMVRPTRLLLAHPGIQKDIRKRTCLFLIRHHTCTLKNEEILKCPSSTSMKLSKQCSYKLTF